MEGSSLKQFKVTDVSRKKKYLIMYETFQTFVKKCKLKFSIPDESMVFFVSEEDEDTEIDSDILATSYANQSVLIMKVEGEGLNSHKSDTTADEVKLRASNADFKDIDTEEDEHLRSDMGAVRQVEEYEIDEWEKIEGGYEIKEHVSKFGFKDIGNVLKKSLDKWREKPLHIAVTGASGKGKSSFINALRGLSPQDPGAAEVNVNECTNVITPYRHPELDTFVIWDIPGVGTTTFPQASYLEKINVDKYDFFIVVTTERFTALDTWLLNEIKLRKKRRYIIRTKIDIDMESVKRDRRKRGRFDENRAFVKLKKEILDEIIKSMKGESDFRFFMISNYHTNKYDFPDLELQLFKDVPSEQKTAMVFGVAGISKEIVEEKAIELRSRILNIALMSGVGAAIPIPFLSTGMDVAIILREVLFYRSQFALEDSSLENLADMANVTLHTLKEKVELQTPEGLCSTAGLSQYLAKYIAAGAAKKVAQYTIPVIGTVISCSASYKSTQMALSAILEMMKKDAIKVLQFVAEKNGESA